MNNTENEGLILSGLLAEHAAIMDTILRMGGGYNYYEKTLSVYEQQLARIENLIFKIIGCGEGE